LYICNVKQLKLMSQQDKTGDKKMNRVLNYNGKVEVVKSTQEAKAFIENLGFQLNPTTEENIELMFGELENHHFGYYFYKRGYRVECLKPKGISTGDIKFAPTECATTKEYVQREDERNARYNEVVRDIVAAAKEAKERLSNGERAAVYYDDRRADIVNPCVAVTICWGYIMQDWWKQERTLHVCLDTLMVEDVDVDVNVFDYLKNLK